jgi:hypothetical protein
LPRKSCARVELDALRHAAPYVMRSTSIMAMLRVTTEPIGHG